MPNKPGQLIKVNVPSDNSSLFASVGYLLTGKFDNNTISQIRENIVMEVRSDPNIYNEAVLGRPVDAYCTWITEPTSRGGSIELAILTRHYKVQMAVVNIANETVIKFGEDRDYRERGFLLYTGVHYDPIGWKSVDGDIQRMFPVEDLVILRKAEAYVGEPTDYDRRYRYNRNDRYNHNNHNDQIDHIDHRLHIENRAHMFLDFMHEGFAFFYFIRAMLPDLRAIWNGGNTVRYILTGVMLLAWLQSLDITFNPVLNLDLWSVVSLFIVFIYIFK